LLGDDGDEKGNSGKRFIDDETRSFSPPDAAICHEGDSAH
jgi:hypothetical protein